MAGAVSYETVDAGAGAVGRIARIMLNRPETRNAIDDETAAALREACRQASEDEAVSVVVLGAAGPAFCAGADLTSTEALSRRRVSDAVAAIPMPVVAAIQGDALGQGLELALACDLRVVAEGAALAMDQVRHGSMPWDGGTQRLPRAIAKGVALELLLTGRPVSAREALELGLAAEIAPAAAVESRALELAVRLAAMAPIAAAYAKEAVLKGMDMPLDQAVRLEADLAILLHSTADRLEGIRSFLEKRRPRFRGS